ncbi:hypothetical protein FRC03_008439 [Tulasnella sp. 419]|nr:hypothetical protein FRC03_008439 [Tulasnella sp. 419]
MTIKWTDSKKGQEATSPLRILKDQEQALETSWIRRLKESVPSVNSTRQLLKSRRRDTACGVNTLSFLNPSSQLARAAAPFRRMEPNRRSCQKPES